MYACQRKSGTLVLAKCGLNGFPINLAVALFTIKTQCALMDILMASAAATRNVNLRDHAVIMAAQTGGGGVAPFQGIPCFLLMVKMEVRFHDIPTLRNMADVAPFGEGFVGHHRPPFLIPLNSRILRR